jgi:phosphonopyruvate decarboxylase
VLLQNSGTGNLINPITSLNIPYRIPSLLFISGRAYPDGQGDEPQHRVMGASGKKVLESLGIKVLDMPETVEQFDEMMREADEHVSRGSGCVVFMVPKGLIAPGTAASHPARPYCMSRKRALEIITSFLKGNEALVSTTGKISRELFATLDRKGNFYMQGSMGHARSIALGIALNCSERRVVLLDGDGATLMHLGSISTVGYYAPRNLVDIVLDNEAHGSTGNQDTTSGTTDLALIARACNYVSAYNCTTTQELESAMEESLRSDGPCFIAVKINLDEEENLPRITSKYQPETTARLFREFVCDRRK